MAMKEGTKMFVFLAGLFLIVLAGTGRIPIPFLGATTGPDGTPVSPVTEVKVTGEKACGSTTMTMDFEEKYAQSTGMTAQNGTIYITSNGEVSEKGTFSEGGTFTAQGGDVLDVYYALDPAQTTYYASHATGKIPCTGQTAAFSTSSILEKGNLAGTLQDPAHKVFRADTGLTVTIINDDNTQNIGSSTTGKNQSVGAGETVNLEVRLKPTFERGYGVAKGSTLACQFNDSAWDQSKSEVSLDGNVLPVAEFTPTSSRFPLVHTDFTSKYWQVPPIDGKLKSRLDFIFNVKGDDTNQPTNGGRMGNAVDGANWNCSLLDTDLYKNDDGLIKADVEDRDDNSEVGVTNFAFHMGFN